MESASSGIAVFCVGVAVCTKDVYEVTAVEELALKLCVVVEAQADNGININT
jgi:hypothetical protein